jgi:hypothetical protein
VGTLNFPVTAGKVMAPVSLDVEEVIHIELMPQDKTINTDTYCDML